MGPPSYMRYLCFHRKGIEYEFYLFVWACGGQRTTLGLRCFPALFSWDKVSSWTGTHEWKQAGWSPSPGISLFPLPLCWNYNWVPPCPDVYLTWVLRIELRSSYLQCKHFTNWPISPACKWILNTQNILLKARERVSQRTKWKVNTVKLYYKHVWKVTMKPLILGN